jgi:hypothetical protein
MVGERLQVLVQWWVGGSRVRNGERPWGRCVKVLWVVGDTQLKVGGHGDGGRPWGMWVRLWGRWERK